MHLADYVIFLAYFLGILGIGVYFFRKNENREDFFVGGRAMSASHVGMSIVATDVGGGFSIGLGGLGFLMGLSGSWLLFTGLVGAWLAAVLVIPRIKKIDRTEGMLTYPDFLRHHFGHRVALVASVISAIGYLGFTGAQILAGAKLAAGTVLADVAVADPVQLALFVMTGIVVLYTVLGGIKAVIYTDTLQWIVLLGGLLFLGVPFVLIEAGGWQAMRAALPEEFFSLGNIEAVTLVNWVFTIVPIWFIAMTLYQRIYACRNEREARRAFYIAGILEYPILAFLGVFLGMAARIFYPGAEAEIAMPMMLRDLLPIGVTGVLIASYFSAIMSTADSCLIASSGNIVNDILERHVMKKRTDRSLVRISRWITLAVGLLALLIAASFTTVLEIILHAYSFMVAGLFVPTLCAYFLKRNDSHAALWAMIGGGSTTLVLIFTEEAIPFGLDPSIPGIFGSALLYALVSAIRTRTRTS